MSRPRIKLAQDLYDWLSRNFRIWGGAGFVWKRGIFGMIAEKIYNWLYDTFDIIPF